MQLKNSLTAAVAGTAFAFGGSVSGQSLYSWDVSADGDWRNAANWDCQGDCPSPAYPHRDVDTVVIDKDVVVSLTLDTADGVGNIETGELTVGQHATLQVFQATDSNLFRVVNDTESGAVTIHASGSNAGRIEVLDDLAAMEIEGKVTLETESVPALVQIGDGTLDVGGTVRMTGAFTHDIEGIFQLRHEESVVEIEESMSIEGGGAVDMWVPFNGSVGSRLYIAGGETLTSEVLIHGAGLIDRDPGGSGTATLVNLGEVRADEPGEILMLGADLDLEDLEGAKWVARGENGQGPTPAFLEIHNSAGDNTDPQLQGEFVAEDGGVLRFMETITVATEGTLDQASGTVQVECDAWFIYDWESQFVFNNIVGPSCD